MFSTSWPLVRTAPTVTGRVPGGESRRALGTGAFRLAVSHAVVRRRGATPAGPLGQRATARPVLRHPDDRRPLPRGALPPHLAEPLPRPAAIGQPRSSHHPSPTRG